MLIRSTNSIIISYTALGTYNSGNTFTAQISNSAGSFSGTPTTIGSVNATSSGTINVLLPINLADGTGYKIRVIASSPSTTGTANQFPITIMHYPCLEPKFSLNSEEVKPTGRFEVHPNPANSKITLTMPSDKKEYSASIIDLNGKVVLHTQISNALNYDLDLQSLPSGAYVVKLVCEDEFNYKKLIISKN